MKTLSLKQALSLGFTTVRDGLDHYIPVKVDGLELTDSQRELVSSRFDGADKDGRFSLVIPVDRDNESAGLLVVTGTYDENDGTSVTGVYAALKVS